MKATRSVFHLQFEYPEHLDEIIQEHLENATAEAEHAIGIYFDKIKEVPVVNFSIDHSHDYETTQGDLFKEIGLAE